MLSAVIAVALLSLGHNRSEGRSAFVVDSRSGRVDIHLEFSTLDTPELCQIDLATPDAAERRQREQRLAQCVETGPRSWLRMNTDAGACTIAAGAMRIDGLILFVDSSAVCPPLAGHTLVVDWGPFAGQALDHISVTEVRVVGRDDVDRTILSKRNSKLRIAVPAPSRASWAPTIMTLLGVVVLCIIAISRRLQQRAKRARHADAQ